MSEVVVRYGVRSNGMDEGFPAESLRAVLLDDNDVGVVSTARYFMTLG